MRARGPGRKLFAAAGARAASRMRQACRDRWARRYRRRVRANPAPVHDELRARRRQRHDFVRFELRSRVLLRHHFKFEAAAPRARMTRIRPKRTSGCASGRAVEQRPGHLPQARCLGHLDPGARDEGAQRIAAPRRGQRAQRRHVKARAVGERRRDPARATLVEQRCGLGHVRGAAREGLRRRPASVRGSAACTRWRRKLRAKRVSALVGSSIQRRRALRA